MSLMGHSLPTNPAPAPPDVRCCPNSRHSIAVQRNDAKCRYCCKSPKLTGDNFPARKRSKSRSLIDMAPGSLPKSPVNLSPSDEVPHVCTRKSHPRLGKNVTDSAKRLLQHNLPIADIGMLLDHFVGAGEQRWRHGEAQSLGGLQVDRQLVLYRRLHWQIRWFLPLEYAINVAR